VHRCVPTATPVSCSDAAVSTVNSVSVLVARSCDEHLLDVGVGRLGRDTAAMGTVLWCQTYIRIAVRSRAMRKKAGSG